MALEAINAFQPNRMLYLRGFDGRGASAALHSTSATGFTVSGEFKDAADFAVLVIFDEDDNFGHPRIKYLPQPNLAGVVLAFDLTYTNLQTIDSPKFPTIDWPYLDVIRSNQTTAQIPLFAHAVQSGGTYTKATCQFTVVTPVAVIFDRLTLWYQNIAFDFIAGGGETAAAVATNLAAQINANPYTGSLFSLTAVAAGAVITITANPAGIDGNMIRMYAEAKNANLTTSGMVSLYESQQFAGGSSAATWTVTLDFTALGIADIRQAFLTFAPQLADSAAYVPSTWSAVFTNWGITADPNGHVPLKVAGANSVRVEETDSWCTFTGAWTIQDGFFSQGFAKVSSTITNKVVIAYTCSVVHDLYVGTSLYSDRGKIGVVLDGDVETLLDCYLATEPAINTRRLVRTAVAAGSHSVTLTVRAKNAISSANFCYFDFLEAANPTDVPDAPGPYPGRQPAIDYDTDFQLSPERYLWMFDKLGLTAGPGDAYVGVLWLNRRTVSGETISAATVTFGGTFVGGDAIFLVIGGVTIGKSVFPADTLTSIAAHFAFFINETFSGVVASASGAVLTITCRSAAAAYSFSFTSSTTSALGTLTVLGNLTGGVPGTWYIDDSLTPYINTGTTAWFAALFAGYNSRGWTISGAFSMEEVNPPVLWAALFPDGSPVITSTGFGGLFSTQCAPMHSGFLAYQKNTYIELAGLMSTAGLVPQVQFGEFLWWFFANASGMAYRDAETLAAAAIALGRPLYTFLTPNDNPNVNAFADANFIRARLASHVAAIITAVLVAYPACLFELLYPYDVNYPVPYGSNNLGGQLNAYVNLPIAWKTKAGSGFDFMKIEALDFGSAQRDLNLVQQAVDLAPGWGWPLDSVRYLFPVFNGGCPYLYEQQIALDKQLESVTPFAMVQVCRFGWNMGDQLIVGGWIFTG